MKSYNPFSLWREEYRLTFKQAAKALDMSLTYYQRLNDGMVMPTGEHLQALFENGGDRPAVANVEYKRWVDDELKKIVFPKLQLNKDTSVEAWMTYRSLLCSLNGIEDSSLAASRLLKINPAILSKWESSKMKNIPSIILERINEYQ